MKVIKKKIKDLKLSDYNPRIHSEAFLAKLKKSMDTYGYVEPIIYNKKTGNIVGGHARFKVLRDQGEKEIQVVEVDIPIIDEKALNVALNKVTGDWDDSMLSTLINEFQENNLDIESLGFDPPEIDELIHFNDPEPPIIEDDYDIPEEPSNERNIQAGDMWLLGKHRVRCGDSVSGGDIGALMDGTKASMVFTDPPYNALTTWKKTRGKKESRLNPEQWFDNDSMTPENYETFLINCFSNLVTAMDKDTPYYVCTDFRVYDINKRALETIGGNVKHLIVWNKNQWGMGWKYRFKHELIIYGTFGENTTFYRGNDRPDVWDIEVDRSGLHSTIKPIQLCADAILDSSRDGGVVLDIFGGAGSTLIAAEQVNRICYMMEIDPHYCNVIIDRWEKFTNKKATKL